MERNNYTKICKNILLIILILVFSMSIFSNNSYSWWSNNFDYRQEIIIKNPHLNNINNFPIYLKVNSTSKIQNDFGDLRFINGSCSSDQTLELEYEIENYTSSLANIWIKIPKLFSGNSSICMYYGNSSISSTENKTEVWDSNYDIVWHLNDATSSIIDSTSNSNDGTSTGVNNTNGVIGNSKHNSGGSNGITSSSNLNIGTNDFTIGGWFTFDSIPSSGTWVGLFGPKHPSNSYNNIFWPQGSDWKYWTNGFSKTSVTISANNTWYYIVATRDSSDIIKFYVDGVETFGGADTDSTDLGNQPLWIGKSSSYPFIGKFDELRISNIARSEEWINETYNLISNHNSFINFKNEEIIIPIIKFVNITPENNSDSRNNWVYINITSDISLTKATLNWNGTNYSMSGSGTKWNYNKTNLENGKYSYFVIGEHINNSKNETKIREINIKLPLNISYINYTTPTGIENNVDSISINLSLASATDLSCYIDFNKKLLGYWNFDNISGTTVYDLSTYSHNGVLTNGANIKNTTKIRGDYGNFDGSDDYVSLSSINVNTSSGGKNTVEFWMYWGGVSSQMPFSWSGANYDLWIYDGCFGFNTFDSNILGISSTGLANSWHHVVATFYNGLANPTDNELYLDGVKQTLTNCRGSVSTSRSVNTNPRISGHSGSYNFGGNIDEFRIWNGALSQDEVNNLYDAKKNYFKKYSNLPDDSYSFYSCGINYDGEYKCTETRNINITFNALAPKLKYLNPTPEDLDYVFSEIEIKVELNESNLDEIRLNWNGTFENLPCSGTSPNYICTITKSGLIKDSNYTFYVVANNTLGKAKSLNLRTIFAVEKTELDLMNPSPKNGETVKSNWTLINISLNSSGDLSSYIDLDKTLVGYFNFENDTSTTVYGHSSYHKTGTLNNGAIIGKTESIRGKSVYMDSDDDYIRVSNLNVNTSSDAKNTVEFWMYWKGSSGEMPIGWEGPNYDLYFSSGNFGFNSGAGDIYGISSAGLINSWHHIVAVFYNGQINNSNNAIYVDGVKQTLTQRQGTSGSKTISDDLIISGWSSSGYKFGGYLDEIKIWNKELSPELINFSYNSQKPNFIYNISNLENKSTHTYKVCSINKYGHENCSSLRTFYVDTSPYIPNDLTINKTIKSINTNIFLVKLKVKNNLNKYKNISLFDFVDNSFTYGSFNYLYNSSSAITGKYSGDLLTWNLSLNNLSTIEINYSISGIGDYKLRNNYLLGLN